MPSHSTHPIDSIPNDSDIAQLPDEQKLPETVKEFGGREGPDPTRYGDWEKNGRCIDF
jgi:hypothetical protein